ncbi:MAG TPA: hypothetical protein VMS31_14155, partial [Pyrinomonadaceae bacterium]|nr:hypothetical protein [Pyrinomonadaceae bacterium]
MKCLKTRLVHTITSVRALAKSTGSFGKSSRAAGRRFTVSTSRLFQPNKVIGIALIVSILATSTPAAPQTIVGLARESSASLAFWFRASELRKSAVNFLQGRGTGKSQEKQRDRDDRVQRIQIFPGDVTVNRNERIAFAAVAYDENNSPVGGVKIKWKEKSQGQGRRARISPEGAFEAISEGSFKIVAEGAGKEASVTVVVRPGAKIDPNSTPTNTRQVSTRDLPSSSSAKQSSARDSIAQRTQAGKNKSKRSESIFRAHARSAESPATNVALLPGDSWDPSNYTSADDPVNRVGSPLGGAVDDGAGSGNFQVGAPVIGLPGRGIDISLGLAYNSRLWNKAGSQLSYDLDRGWPAAGWSLGFGKILGMGVYNGAMIVDADGTRHGFTGTVTEFPTGTTFVGHTTDGSFIDYTYTTGIGGGILFAEAKLPNGTIITYGAPGPGAVYPTSITDPNGNYITITYVQNAGPRIETVLDTLGRSINFHYGSNNLLSAITAPQLGSGTRTLVRLTYRQLNIAQYSNFGFGSSVTAGARESNPWALEAVYYPGTNTGYWFGDSDAYSSYGMLAKAVEARGMSFSGPTPVPPSQGPTEQGSITSSGQATRREVYNYPHYPGDPNGPPSSNLTDAPTYSTLTESWTRDGSSDDQAVTSYSSQPNASPRTVTITLPNGTRSIQYSHNSPGSFLDGLVYQDETRDAANNLLQSSSVTWQQGQYESPRPGRVEATNERSLMTATEFSYDNDLYNQVTEVRNYDYGGALLRATRSQYQNSSVYTSRHIFSLPLAVEVFGGDGARVSKTDYQYDGQSLAAAPNVVQHYQTFNPHADAEGQCYWEPNWGDPDCDGTCSPETPCNGTCSEIFYCPYNQATDIRGNLTQVTSYANVTTEAATVPVVETRSYDVTGNLVTASSSCCQQTSFSFTVDTQYAYAQSQKRGSPSDPYAQVTSSATYDFNTGLAVSSVDANGRTSQTGYSAATLRPES